MKKLFLVLLFAVCINFYGIMSVKAEESYVTAIKIDGEDLEGFESDKLGPYEKKVDSNKSSIKIGYVFASGYRPGQCSLGDDIPLNYGKNELKCEVTKTDGSEAKTYQINIERPDNRSSDNSLTALTVGNNKVVLTDTNEYNVSVTTDTVEIKATPATGAVLVDGYGERTGDNAVKLTDGSATVEIKVKAENENVRTYKLNITKTDYKSDDATLKSLTVEGAEFEFKRTTYEYNISVKNNVTRTKINAVKNNDKATVEYTENVSLKQGENNFEIKVTAEDGTTRTYKLNITREEEVPIVTNIEITDVEFKFDAKTYNYKLETTLTTLEFNVTLRSDTAKYEVTNNENLQDGSTVKIVATDGDDTATYAFKIVNKQEEMLESEVKSNDGNNSFFKKNEMIISLVIFGIGAFALLASILLKKGAVK
ncbi:MAG: cadherin-like beta sandwich domain-containing protein [Bacilli bacterium]|nr:cadherin-like beta sandwich domain-containing protein [Bacilli bacterium]